MLQRKQTLYLLAAMLLLALLYVLPIAEYHRSTDDMLFTFHPWGVENGLGVRVPDFGFPLPFEYIYGALIAALGTVIALFKNRPLQSRILRALFLMILLCGVGQVFVHQSISAYLGTATTVTSSIQVAFVFPFIAVLCCWLAERAIRADEELVRSTDRLR